LSSSGYIVISKERQPVSLFNNPREKQTLIVSRCESYLLVNDSFLGQFVLLSFQ